MQWAAHRSGAKLERTAEYQYMQLKEQGTLIDVDEALQTPGALLFRFSEEPRHGSPRGTGARCDQPRGRPSDRGAGQFLGRGRVEQRADMASIMRRAYPGISDEASVMAYQAGSSRQPASAAYEIDAGTALAEAPSSAVRTRSIRTQTPTA